MNSNAIMVSSRLGNSKTTKTEAGSYANLLPALNVLKKWRGLLSLFALALWVSMAASAPAQTLVDGQGYTWDFYYWSGRLYYGSNHAYDYAFYLTADGGGFSSPSPYTTELDGRQFVWGPATMGGNQLKVTRKAYVSPLDHFVRYLEIIENPYDVDIATYLYVEGNLGSDVNTSITLSSSGDQFVNPTDQWYCSEDPTDFYSSPSLNSNWWGNGGYLAPNGESLNPGWSYFYTQFNFTIPAHSTRVFMHFQGQNLNAAAAAANANFLQALPPAALVGINGTEWGSMANWPKDLATQNLNEGFFATGPAGGPFTPASKDYGITNQTGLATTWTAQAGASWLSLNSNSGTLLAGASTTLTVSINTNANALAVGDYDAAVTITCGRTGMAQLIPVHLKVYEWMQVTPATNSQLQGIMGGPFSPNCVSYTIKNRGTSQISWSATRGQTWLQAPSPSGGLLAAGAETAVNFCLDATADNLTPRVTTSVLTFQNNTRVSEATSRVLQLTVIGVVYVDQNATGLGDGSTWDNAYVTLQDAITTAASQGKWVWVAAGEYTGPFTLSSNVHVYGGFTGTAGSRETRLSQRNWNTNVTTLRGGSSVVTMSSLVNSAIDGFTITGGSGGSYGGGLYISYCNNTNALANCRIIQNTTEDYGGGVYLYSSALPIDNCFIAGNITNYYYSNYGGGLYGAYSSSRVTSCVIVDNFCNASYYGYGGGLYLSSCGSMQFRSCVISGNKTWVNYYGSYGGGIYLSSSNSYFENCLITGNLANGGNYYNAYCYGGGVYCNSSSPSFVNCTIAGNSSISNYGVANSLSGGIYVYSSSNPRLVNTILDDNNRFAIYEASANASPTSLTHSCFGLGNADGDYYKYSGSLTLTGANAINMNVPNATANVGGDISFIMGASSSWTNSTYDSGTGRTTLSDSTNPFTAGALAGKMIVGNTANRKQYYIISNTANSIEVFGDASAAVPTASVYRLADYHLQNGSAALDRADAALAPSTDLEGAARPGSDAKVDIGAYEALASYVPPTDTQAPVSQALTLPSVQSNAIFSVPFAASDAESGVKDVWLMSRKDGGAWTTYTLATQSPISFDTSISGDGRYEFFTVARDNVLNIESKTPRVEAVTVVAANFSGTKAYVDLNATGSELGTSWANAYRKIQTGIEVAAAKGAGQVWVADGAYFEVITMKNGVAVYGGFQGAPVNETLLTQRNPYSNPAVIDGSKAANGAPATHVVTFSNVTTAALNGFIVTGGVTTTGATGNYGAGVYCSNLDSGNEIAYCKLVGNDATVNNGYGGGLYLTAASPAIRDCFISGNIAYYAGGGVYIADSSNPRFENTIISGNSLSYYYSYGGGVYVYNSSPNFINCVISSNYTYSPYYGYGTVFLDSSAAPGFVNCVFEGNNPRAIYEYNSVPTTVSHCLFYSNSNADYRSNTFGDLNGANNINMNVPQAWNNVDGNPSFLNGDSGTWTNTPIYDPITNRTTLFDTAKNFADNALKGLLLNPNNSQYRQALILSNTSATIEVADNCTGFVSSGIGYRILDYHLTDGSAALDRGYVAAAAPNDFDWPPDARPGTDGLVDIGADEAQPSFTPAADVTSPVSRVQNLPTEVYTAQFGVPFVASDSGSHVKYVELWYQRESGAWTQWPGTYANSPISFNSAITGGSGRYRFFTIATDNANNVEDMKAVADDDTLVISTFAGSCVYVDKDATGEELGTDWTNALRSINTGLRVAANYSVTQVWVKQGVYNENVVMQSNVALYGSFVGTELFASQRAYKAMEFKPAGTVIVGPGSVAAVAFNQTTTTTLDGFTLRRTGGSGSGGGAYFSQANASNSIINCAFTGSNVYYGGGIYMDSSAPLIKDCVIAANYANDYGGAFYISYSQPVLDHCHIASNRSYSHGGAIYAYNSTISMNRCTIIGNQTTYGNGGAIYNNYCNLTAVNCFFDGNESGYHGGAIFSYGDYYGNWGKVNLVNCLLRNNVVLNGGYYGGIYLNYYANLSAINTIFTGNTRGAIYESDNTTTPSAVMNCCFFNNPDGDYYDFYDGTLVGAARINGSFPGATGNVDGDPMLRLSDSGVWDGAPVYDAANYQTALTDSTASFPPGVLVGRNICPNTSSRREALITSNTGTVIYVAGDWTGAAPQGSVYTFVSYRTVSGSSCIDRGTSNSAPSVDIDNNPRPVDVPNVGATGAAYSYDIGVYEAPVSAIDALSIVPSLSFDAAGPPGGPFAPSSRQYTLKNIGGAALNWQASVDAPWLAVSPASGNLGAGVVTTVTLALNGQAALLTTQSIYSAAATFINLSSGAQQQRLATLHVFVDHFTEYFSNSDNDLDNTQITFTPDGSANFYNVCAKPVDAFPVDPASGVSLGMTGYDTYAQVDVPTTLAVSLYGTSYTTLYVGSNGYITFNSGDTYWSPSFASHFNQPRISGLYYEFGIGSADQIVWNELPDRVVVTYQNLGGNTSYQIEMFTTGTLAGTIRLTYLGIGISGGLAGLSDGHGTPAGFVESDLTAYVCQTGSVAFDKPIYNCSSDMAIELADAGLAGALYYTLTVTAQSGDSELVELAELPINSGSFYGTLQLSGGVRVPGDGVLEVVNGDTISAVYHDALTGLGGSANVTAIAHTDCHAPQVSNVQVTNLYSNQATVTFDLDEKASAVYVYYYYNSCYRYWSASGDAATTHQAIVLNLYYAQTTYYFSIETHDANGNVGVFDNGGVCYTLTAPARADYFTEWFSGSNDLSNQTLLFTPDGSNNFYAICRNATSAFPTDPAGGVDLGLVGNDFTSVTLTGGKTVSLYGMTTSVLYIGANGYITFGAGDIEYTPSPTNHFDLPRISGLFEGLAPTTGALTFKQFADRAVVTWNGVPRWGFSDSNSFQIELYYDGTITITQLAVSNNASVLCGLSRGQGVPPDFINSNLSGYGSCSRGTIFFDKSVYSGNDTVHIRVTDSDLKGIVRLLIGVATSGGDSEVVQLIETPANSGVFIRQMPTQVSTVVTSDLTLQVADGQTITATYNDADDGTGSPRVVQATALVDARAPVISSVTITGVYSNQAIVNFSTDEQSATQIRYGLACGSLTQTKAGAAGTTQQAILLNSLTPGTQYFFTVVATDPYGNGVEDDNHGACYSFQTPATINYYTEWFNSYDFDLSDSILTFMPDGSASFYQVCRSPITEFAVDPTSATPISLANDDSALITLSTGTSVLLYGQAYNSFYIGSNGYITFTAPDTQSAPSYGNHFNAPRVSALFTNLNPETGGVISWQELPDRAVVTFSGVPTYYWDPNSFQIELFFNGAIRITYLTMSTQNGIVGLSQGQGLAPDFVESNLGAAADCGVGILQFNSDLYNCSDIVGVQLTDVDQVGQGITTVTVTNTVSDTETLTLVETPAGSGQFSGYVNTSGAAAVVGDHILEVADGQTIRVQYMDTQLGTTATQIRTDTAQIDCAPPIISGVTLAQRVITEATIAFDLNEADPAEIRYGTDCSSTIMILAVNGASTHRQGRLTSLLPATTYYYKVAATDAAGNVAVDDNGGMCYSFTTYDWPDVTVSALTPLPATLNIGEQLSVSWTVHNALSGPALGVWTDKIYLSADDQPGGDIALADGERLRASELAPGGDYSAVVNVQIPAVAPGDYFIVAKADVNGELTEKDDNNNTRVAGPIHINAQNLVASDIAAVTGAYTRQRVDVSWKVANHGTVGVLRDWEDGVYLSADGQFNGGDPLIGQMTRPSVLLPGNDYTNNTSVVIPGVAEGDYWLMAKADIANVIMESDETDNVTSMVVHVSRPNLAILTATAPSAAGTGANIQVTWQVSNPSLYPAVAPWTDKIYLSDYMTTTPDVLLGSIPHADTLGVGGDYTSSASLQIPGTVVEGNYFVLVVANGDGGLPETTLADNATSSGWIAITRPNLLVTDVQKPDVGYTARQSLISWTVKCDSTVAAVGDWVDKIYLSNDAVIGGDIELLSLGRPVTLDPGQTYARSATVTIPKNLPGGDYYFVVKTDANDNLPERDETDNTTLTSKITIIVSPCSDLSISNVQILNASVYPGDTAYIDWDVTNIGAVATDAPFWNDRIYLSRNTAWDSGDIHITPDFQNPMALASGESYHRTGSFTVPTGLVGEYYVVVVCDASNNLDECNESNNSALSAGTIDVQVIIPPIISVTHVQTTPTALVAGAPIDVSWSITNTGGQPATNFHLDFAILLSSDGSISTGDDYFFNYHVGVMSIANLAVGEESTSVTVRVNLPFDKWGDWNIIVWPDPPLWMPYQRSFGVLPVTIDPPFPSDLMVDTVDNSTQGVTGYPVNVQWTVRNASAEPTHVNYWVDAVYLTQDPNFLTGNILVGQYPHYGVLETLDSTYTAQMNVPIPNNISGTYWVFVKTDVNNAVYEYTYDDNNLTSSPNPIVITAPDLTVASVNASSEAISGQMIHVDWAVQNIASVPTWGGASWSDRIWLSVDNDLGTAADNVLLGSSTYPGGVLDAGSSYTKGADVLLPESANGSYYFFVVTDAAGQLYEADEGNNAASGTTATIVAYRPADLQITKLTVLAGGSAPVKVESNSTLRVDWTVKNMGTGLMNATSWNDAIYLSDSGVVDANARLVATVPHNGQLDVNSSYNGMAIVTIPIDYVGAQIRIIVVTDAQNSVYESDNTNNTRLSRPFEIVWPHPDLVITNVGVSQGTPVNEAINISWTIQNRNGQIDASQYWSDVVYLSNDRILDAGDTVLRTLARSGPLGYQAAYSRALYNVPIPPNLTGEYYIIVQTDAQNTLDESDESNNTRLVVLRLNTSPDAPDLTVASIDAPSTAASGQQMTFSYTVNNVGGGPATAGYWYDALYLSRDPYLDPTQDVYLGYYTHTGALDGGSSYTVAQTIRVPSGLSGAYYVIVVTDSNNAVTEANESNNLLANATAIQISLPPPADLLVNGASIVVANPGTAKIIGENLSVDWTVDNVGASEASGGWSDAVYLSADNYLDINDLEVGKARHQGTLNPGGSYAGSLFSPVPPMAPGLYHVLLRTDVFNEVRETAEGELNNTTASLGTITVDCWELPLGTTDTTHQLSNGVEHFYKITNVPSGADLLVSLDCGQNTAFNDLYLRYGTVPDRGHYDLTNEDNWAADQTLVVPGTTSGTYYVMIHADNISGAADYSISAQLIPFTMRNINPETAGNAGQITLEIQGARFTPTTTFQFVPAGNPAPILDEIRMGVKPVKYDGPTTLIVASSVHYVNSALVYATFDLTGVDTGSYDLYAVRFVEELPSNNTTATLAAAFTITPGVGPHVTLALNGPSVVRVDRIYTFYATYTNIGDSDAVAPLITLYSPTNTAMGVKLNNLASADTLQILGINYDKGPAGILRPGQQFSVPIYYMSGSTPMKFRAYLTKAEDARPIDWDALELQIKPSNVDPNLWPGAFEAVKMRVGTSWGSYVGALAKVATRMGDINLRTADVKEMWAYFMGGAIGVGEGTISGVVYDDSVTTPNTPLGNVQVILWTSYNDGIIRTTTSSANGAFTFRGIVRDQYEILVADREVDPPVVLTHAGVGAVTNVKVHTKIPAAVPVVPPKVYYEAPQILTLNGETHLIYIRDGQVYHALRSGGDWTPPQAVPNVKGTNVKAIASPNLLGGTDAGLALFWQEGWSGNDIAIKYALGRKSGADWQWSQPALYTSGTVASMKQAVTADASGKVVSVWQMRDMTDIEDDTDLYYKNGQINPADVSWDSMQGILLLDKPVQLATGETLPAGTPVFIMADGSAYYVRDRENCKGWAESFNITFSFKKDGNVPAFIPYIGGRNNMEVAGQIAGEANLIGAKVSGNVSGALEFLGGRVTGQAGGQVEVVWKIDKKTCKYVWDEASLTGFAGAEGKFPIPQLTWATPSIPFIGTLAKIEVGIIVGGKISGTLFWKAGGGLIPSGKMVGDFKLGFYGLFECIGGVEVTVTGTGNLQVTLDKTGISISDAFFSIEVEVKWKRWKFTFGARYPDRGDDPILDYPYGDAPPKRGPRYASLDAAIRATMLETDRQKITETVVMDPKKGRANVWGSNSVLSDVASDLADDSEPALAVGPDGSTIHLLWSHASEDPSVTLADTVRTARFNGTAWTAVETIPGSSGFIESMAVAADSAGAMIAVWPQGNADSYTSASDVNTVMDASNRTQMWYARKASAVSPWSTPQAITTDMSGPSHWPVLSTDAAGDLWMIWAQQTAVGSFQQMLLAMKWNSGTMSWPTTATVLASGPVRSAVSLAPVSTTMTMAVWSQTANDYLNDPSISEASVIFSSVYAGGVWSAATTISLVEASPAAAPVVKRDLLSFSVPFFPPKCACESPSPSPKHSPTPKQTPTPKPTPTPSPTPTHSPTPPPTPTPGPTPPPPPPPPPDGPPAPYDPDPLYSRDPNIKVGPKGAGLGQFIRRGEDMEITIHFENDPALANAPAQSVTVTDQLSPLLDWKTFRLVEVTVSSTTIRTPQRARYNGQVDMPNGLRAKVDASINIITGEVKWKMNAVDKNTGQLTTDPTLGLLPVNDPATHDGEGLVIFLIRPLGTAAGGSVITNKATIVFDTNAPIETNEIFNTLDVTAPQSAVDPLPALSTNPNINLTWSGADTTSESGIADYTIYVSEDGGPWGVAIDTTNQSNGYYYGAIGHSYAFYSIARDLTGNVEVAPSAPDTVTFVPSPTVLASPPGLDFGDQHIAAGPSKPLQVTITNAFGADLEFTGDGLAITGPDLSSFQIANSPPLAPLTSGSSLIVTLTFDPSTAGTKNASLLITTNDINNSSLTVSLTGVGMDTPLMVTGGPLLFGDQRVDAGPTAAQAVSLINTTATAIHFTGAGIALTGADPGEFSISNAPSTGSAIIAGTTPTISVKFDPTSPGFKTAFLRITTDGGDSNVALSGNGLDQKIAVSTTSLTFPDQDVDEGPTAPMVVTIINTGTADLRFTAGGIQIAGANADQFAFDGAPSTATLAPGASVNVALVFNPSSVGDKSATLLIATDDRNQPLTSIALAGSGIDEQVQVSPLLVDFTGVDIEAGPAGPLDVTITNVGTNALSFTGAGILKTGDTHNVFMVVMPSTATLAPGGSAIAQVYFAPVTQTTESANLIITTSDDAQPTVTVSLTGFGVSRPGMPFNPNPPNGAIDVPLDVAFSWSTTGSLTSYDIFLWKSAGAKPATPTSTGLTSASFIPPDDLDHTTAYSWQILAHNFIAVTTGPVWTFQTIPYYYLAIVSPQGNPQGAGWYETRTTAT
ncbi:MAG: choice-of-anchor D domain-containing protein [Candidatus Sumerlaeota bacterium]|nr:choice-of-anchor D domain-containing protein [Candidatus Sumerlaeota bacterium]